MLRLAACLFTSLMVSLACGGERSSAPATSQDAAPTKEAPAGGAAQPKDTTTGLTGAVSEEAFKKLHELTGEAAPPAKGETIDLAGSKAYLSLPEGDGPFPGVIVIHEWWGLNEHMKHWSDRLAASGYAALAVDLYGGKIATTSDDAMAYMKAVDEAAATKIMAAAHAFLAEDARVKAPRRGVIGWCFGGAWSLKTAIALPDLDAAVIYYGRLETDPAKLQSIKAPLLGIFGTQDQGIPPSSVEAFKNGLDEAGKSAEIFSFDAQHAFANPSSGRYDHTHAAAAWEHTSRFLAKHLGGG